MPVFGPSEEDVPNPLTRLESDPGTESPARHEDGVGGLHESDEARREPDGESAQDMSTPRQWAGLVLLAILAVSVGFAAGRVLRSGDGAPVADESAVAPVDGLEPALDGAVDLPDTNHPLMGQTAPDFTMTDLTTGEPVSLSDHQGSPVLVNFWATWCPPCRAEMPWLEAATQRHPELVVLAVNAGERVSAEAAPATVTSFVDQMGLSFPVLLGDNTYTVQDQWSVWGLPATFLVDADGDVRGSLIGMYPNQATLERHLERILQQG